MPISPSILVAAQANGLFGATRPAHLMTPAQSAAYWSQRDATQRYAALAAARPDFAAMLLCRKGDHVQTPDDHPHVRQAYDGFVNHGPWCRLNGDAAYYQRVAGTPPAGYVETPANVAVPMGDMKAHAEPNTVNLNSWQAAVVAEMADRACFGVWDPDLAAAIVPDSVLGVHLDPPGAARATVVVLGTVRADGMLRSRFSGGWSAAPARVALLDAAGRVVRRAEIAAVADGLEWRWELGDAGALPAPGIYWLTARQADGAEAGARAVVVR